MPRQNIKDIYQIRTCKWKSTYKIKVSENTHFIGLETKTIDVDPHFSRASPLDRRDSLFYL